MELAPDGVVTVTFTVPVPAGAVTVIEVALVTEKLATTVDPNLTAVAPVKSVPVRVTGVPPEAGPVAGDRAVTVGAGTT